MVVHTLGMLVALQGSPAGPAEPGIDGTVRAVEDGRLLVRVLVEAPDDHRWTLSDSLGQYHLANLSPGTHRLRFQVPGRVTLELTALVPASTTVRLDVELTQKPQELAPVVVMAPLAHADSQGSSAHPRPPSASSTWALRAAAAGRDLESALMNGEGALSHGGGGGTLHFQGGASDQVLLRLDGFPVYGARHFGSAWSAINPDVVQDIAVQTGATPSEDGARLSGTVDVRTSLLARDNVHAQGAVTPGDVRQLVRGELPGGRGNFLLSGRRSLRSFFSDGSLGEQNGYDDWLGSMALNVGGGRLRFLLYRAANQLAFESRVDSISAQGEAAGSTAKSPSPLNNLEWVTSTAGIAWEGKTGNHTVGLSAWRAGLGTSVRWLDPSNPLGVSNQFVELGIRGQSTWLLGQGDLTAGFSIRQLRSDYAAHALATSSSQSLPAGVGISSAPTIMSGSVRQRWHWGSTASLEAGARANWASFGWAGTEPWLALEVRPWHALTLSAQAGRAYQFTQSWTNEESFLTTFAGMEVPVAVGATGMPVARSDNLAAQVVLNTGAGWTLGLEGYTRRLGNLFLVAPSSTQPFSAAVAGFGRGSASGLILRSSLMRGPAELALFLGLTRASRALGTIDYTPGFERTGFLHAAALFHLDRGTALGFAVTAGTGQPTTPLTAFDWQPYNPWSSNGELAGTPANLGGPINSYRLPGLRRVDVGLRREWRLGQWTTGRAITTSLTLENLLNHPNAIGLVGTQSALQGQFLNAGSRALRLELGWTF
jgi:hypothetical protein